MGIDDESSHPELCSEVADGVTRNIVCLFREPDAGNPPVRFDEREEETEPSQTGLRRRGESPVNRPREATVTAPLLDSTHLSDNVGVSSAFRAHCGTHSLRRAPFRSPREFSRANQGSPRSPLGQNFGPTHASLQSPTAIMITSSDPSVKRSRMPNQFLGVYCSKLTSFTLSKRRIM